MNFGSQQASREKLVATMMRLGSSTARRAWAQARNATRSTHPSHIPTSATFSTCSVHNHSKTSALWQDQQQTSQPSFPSAAPQYQSYRPDPRRVPVLPISLLSTDCLETRLHPGHRGQNPSFDGNGSGDVRRARTILPSPLYNHVPF